ncbi:MAG TPA: secretin N-terminal domain-containing protein, partial [Tepidisphaeraceae bacterium]|nr:secretin N-terminal domain-containing protein [Tepidisphaeraceae bacterium]
MKPTRLRSWLLCAALGGLPWSAAVFAQGAPATQPAPVGELVTLDFPADGIELSLLADIVTQRLHIPILYDEQTKGKKVIIRVPAKVPESALMGILQSALRMKQMALIDAEQPGWMQIVPAPSLAGVAKPAGMAGPAEGPVAQVFILNHADPVRLTDVVRPFLTQPAGYVQGQQGQKVLVVCDYPSVLKRVEQLLKDLDSDAPPVDVRFVPLKEAEAQQVAPAVSQLIATRESYQWGNAQLSGIFLSADERTNQIVVVAPPARMKEVEDLITGMDKAPELHTKVYRLKSVSPERVDKLVKNLLGPSLVKRGYQAAIDHDSQLLIVSATPQVHARIDELLKELDVPVTESDNPMQFYKLKNTKAADVLATIGGLVGESTNTTGQTGGAGNEEQSPEGGATAPSRGGGGAPGSGSMGGGPGNGLAPQPAAPQPSSPGGIFGAGANTNGTPPVISAGGSTAAGSSGLSIGNSSNTQYVTPVVPFTNQQNAPAQGGVLSVHSRNATVAADANTNSIIVIAPPNIQQMYADLIKRLDERRPQVQIECTIVTLNTADGFNYGIDIGRLGGFGNSQLISFSSFGVSNVNPATGGLTPINAPGGTFALLSPRIADIVINALKNSSRARFVSAPQLLVNDNGKGKLESVAQEPFAVILDASTTQSLTSLGGLAQAGTSISVEPHISEANYLQLGYSIELSNFTGAAQNGLPPPSQKNAVDSSVTIPDGYTIVVGGLTTKNFAASTQTIPIIGDIPILKYLFGNHNQTDSDS